MIPEALRLHHASLIKVAGGEQAFSQRDQETMRRLLSAPAAWCDFERDVGVEWLPPVFDALWITNLDWGAVRHDGVKSRKTSAGAKIEQIKGAAAKLERLLDELHVLLAPTGGGPGRNPDAWPDSPALRSELAALAERCQTFDPEHMGNEYFVNMALAAREANRVYLRALVAKLDEIGFPFGEGRTPCKPLIDLADIAANTDGAIDYDAFYAVLQPEKKRRRE